MEPLTPPLWKHQQAALEFVRGRWQNGCHGVLLALVMGGGKSRVAIQLAQDLNASLLLILAPRRVIEVWRTQFERFAPGRFHFQALDDRVASVQEKTALARERVRWGQRQQQPVAIAINYDSARVPPFASWALTQIWPLAILDESHKIKQPGGRTSRWCAQLGLRARRRLALTGTPMPHEPTDIWAQFRFLDPTRLDPSYSAYRARYAILGGFYHKQVVGWQNLDLLEGEFRQLAFRVDESVLDLPPELDQTLSTDLSPSGRRLYAQMEQEMIAWLEDGREVTAANALVKLLRLAQITGGTIPDSAGRLRPVDPEHPAKQTLLQEVLEDVGEPVVVFARFRPDLEAIHAAARAAGLASGELSGTRDDLAEWQKPTGPPVLAVQIQAGGVGIDLTRARIAVYYSLDFSLSNYLQSRARIRRPPQQRPCLFLHLQIRDSVDEYVLRAVAQRRDLVDFTLQELKTKGTPDAYAAPLAAC